MIYDYSNFPPHTYELQYPAPGAPALAERIVELLRKHGLPAATDAKRGFDHGVFIPFLLVFPDAEIPVVPLSLKAGLDPEEHMAAGRGPGQPARRGRADRRQRHELSQHARLQHAGGDRAVRGLRSLADRRGGGARSGAAAREASPTGRRRRPAAPPIPREEHLLPLMVAAGAAGGDKGERVFSDVAMMARLSGYRFG